MSKAAGAVAVGLLLAIATAGTANAYWHASGSGTGTATTKAGSPRVITLSLTSASGHRITAAGNAGLAPNYNPSVTVVLCKVNTWPCLAAQVAATLSATATSGTGAYTTTTANLNGVTVYGRASQLESSGWTDYSAIVGPITG